MRRLAFDDPGPASTSSRPPAAWIWAGVIVVAAIVLGVALWVVSLAHGGFGADNRTVPTGLESAHEHERRRALRAGAQDSPPCCTRRRAPPSQGTRSSASAGRRHRPQKGDTVNLWVSTGTPQATVPKLGACRRTRPSRR